MGVDDQQESVPWTNVRQTGVVPVAWDASQKRFLVSLRGVSLKASPDQTQQVNIYFDPPVLYDIRIRKVGEDFGVGFISPSNAAVFVGIQPDTDYEVRTQAVDAKTGEPLPDAQADIQRVRTGGKK